MKYLKRKDVIEKFNNQTLIFSVKKNKSGTYRVYVDNTPTIYHASGGGYDKESSAIAELINDLIGAQDYKNAYTGKRRGKRYISNGIGVRAVKEALKVIGVKLELVEENTKERIYSLTVPAEKLV